jgi:hypothetical protein
VPFASPRGASISSSSYKVDRLTRSLADFAKLVETFDATDSGVVIAG